MLFKTLLCAAFCGALLVPARAQTPETVQNAPATQSADKSGYELLTQAGTKILPGPNGGASATEANLSPTENLRRERLAVARNASALALVRQALQQPIEVPQKSPEQMFPLFARGRELARQFSQESDVRFADGDFVGAMNSKLDTMELSTAFGRGSFIAGLVSVAIEAIGNRGADRVAAHLDAAQCRAAAARLETIEARRATLAQVLRDEERYSLQLETGYLANYRASAKPKPLAEDDFYSKQDIADFKTLSPDKLAQDNARLFDALVASASAPYSNAAPALPPAGELNPFTRGHLMWAGTGRYRFNFARPVAQNRLLRAGLELRARKLESGTYPTQFAAPIDPFSPTEKPLVYQKTTTGFLLYSIGPDGKDSGGKPIRGSLVFDPQSGDFIKSPIVDSTSRGDLVQAPF